jgi:hypothetical protein
MTALRDLERQLLAHGCTRVRHGARHEVWRCDQSARPVTVPRHRSLPLGTAEAIWPALVPAVRRGDGASASACEPGRPSTRGLCSSDSAGNACVRCGVLRTMRRLIWSIALFGLLVVAAPAEAAAPRYIMVSGPGLVQPVTLANWRQNLDVMMEIVNGDKLAPQQRAGLADRPRLRLSLFWGWGGKPPKWPSQSNQTGWYWPASDGAPAIVATVIGGKRDARVASLKLLGILRRHHVPLSLP